VERNDDYSVRLGESVLRTSRAIPRSASLRLALRSEMLVLAPETGPSANVIQGTLAEVIYQGDSVLALIDLAGGARVMMRQAARRDLISALPEAGRNVRLAIEEAHTIVVAAEAD
jgi:putative spermidine/putrescine transport system ATP-binding protein